jgi:integrase
MTNRIQTHVNAKGETTYTVKYRTAQGVDKTKRGFRTKKEARAFKTARQNDLRLGIDYDPNAGKVLFRDVAAEWLDSRADLKVTTLAGHRAAFAPKAQRRGTGKTLGIDAVFGDCPIGAITRDTVQAWVNKLTAAGKKPSTVRHEFFRVRMVLAQAVADRKILANPAEHVKIPTEGGARGGKRGVVDRAQFLTAAQVQSLVAALPWPYNIMVHLAAWSGLRAAELAGLQVGDVEPGGSVRVERSARPVGPNIEYLDTKTDGSFRKVPLPAATVQILRDYVAVHPHADVPTAPLFPGMTLVAPKPTGVRTAPMAVADSSEAPAPLTPKAKAHSQASALADLSITEAEARLQLNWDEPLRHATFYKAVYRPAVLRANRIAGGWNKAHALPAELKFHSLRHTYASLCALAGIRVREVAMFMGHANVTTTEHIYTHLFNTDDHSAAMSALDAMAAPKPTVGGNVVPLRR